jgi:DNA-binding CsgD family transcriptional regulator
MTMTVSAGQTRGTLPGHEVFRAALDPGSRSEDRLVVIEGSAGAGKTHALAAIASAARADGHPVVELRADEGDLVIGAASLEPWIALVRAVTAPGAGSSAAAPARVVDRPFVLVDDFHRLNRVTRAELHTMLTSLAGIVGAVVVLSAADRLEVTDAEDLPAVRIGALTRAAAEELLRADRIALSSSRRATLLRLAAGNPLVLREVGRVWADESPSRGSGPFPVSYPPIPGIPAEIRRALGSLGVRAREAALLVAVATVEFPADAASFAMDAAAVAEDIDAGVLRHGDGAPRFRDPLVRAHLLAESSPGDLGDARAAIARSAGVPERLRVLAEAAAQPAAERVHDDGLVPRLRSVAVPALREHRPQDAVAALREAARLTASGDRRRDLHDEAAVIAAFAGDFVHLDPDAEHLDAAADHDADADPDDADRVEPGPRRIAAAAFVRAIRFGEIRECRRDVIAAFHAATPADDVNALAATLQVLCFLRGDSAWWDDATALLDTWRLDPVLRVVEDCRGDGAPVERERLYALAGASARSGDPWKLVALHVAWTLLDATDVRRDRIELMLADSGDGDDLPGYLHRCRTAVSAFQAGRLEVARAEVERVRSIADSWGAQTFVALAEAIDALICSVQGRADLAVDKADRATHWALEHGAPLVARAADHARSSLDIAMGRFEDAHARSTARPTLGQRWGEHSYGPVALLDAVESAARLRVPAHGLALVRAAEQAVGTGRSPRQAMIMKASRAILEDRADTRALFEEALSTLAADDAPFETARVRLAYGEWLRRTMHALEARTQFRLAASAFDALGAEQWRVRAQSELRVAGGISAAPASTVAVDLSEQEQRVASLAAAGLTNKQIANQLFLSPRTVSGHLYRVFPKLGVTTRAGLRDALVGLQPPHAQPGS